MQKNTAKNQVPDMLFHTAQGFYDVGINCAYKVLKDNHISGFQIMAPAAVNLSFAAELLLKGLVLSSSKKALRGHELEKLYKELPEALKVQIEVRYKFHQDNDKDDKELRSFIMTVYKGKEGKAPNQEDTKDKSLSKLLKAHNKSFESWRYLHEIGESGYTHEIDFKSLHCFIKALVDTINSFPRKQQFFISTPK